MKLVKQYTREIFDNLNYHATWLPSTIHNLGDIGRIQNYQFELITSLSNLGISYEPTIETAPADYEYASKKGVLITIKAAGKAPALGSHLTKAETGICLDFTAADAVVFQAADCEVTTIKNKQNLEADILALKSQGKWSTDFVVITTIVKSKSATIIISNESGAKVELAVDADANINNANIASLKISNNLKYSSNVGFKVIGETNLTPLYKASGIKHRFLSGTNTLVNRGREATSVDSQESFDELDFDDLQYLSE